VIVWLDNHISPAVARWMAGRFGFTCTAIRDLGFSAAPDETVFARARDADAILLTKDRDFAELVNRLGPPPRVIWLTFGNTSTPRLIEILEARLETALKLLEGGALVEIVGEP
jgi:predicted nuclease of predicted toxin-antitoxin system